MTCPGCSERDERIGELEQSLVNMTYSNNAHRKTMEVWRGAAQTAHELGIEMDALHAEVARLKSEKDAAVRDAVEDYRGKAADAAQTIAYKYMEGEMGDDIAFAIRSIPIHSVEVRKALEEAVGACVWKEDSCGCWNTSCGDGFYMNKGSPKENTYKFCPSCGKRLAKVPYKEDSGEVRP